MNVDDFKDVALPEGDRLMLIFNRQRDLMDRYHDIESVNVGHSIPSSPMVSYTHDSTAKPDDQVAIKEWKHAGELNLNDRASQLRMKSFAWRITEEITEATEVLDGSVMDENKITHYLEEMIDALHFSVELLCYAGFDFDDFCPLAHYKDTWEYLFQACGYYPQRTFEALTLPLKHGIYKAYAYSAIEALGMAMNCLKLKEWKSTPMVTDERRFEQLMRIFFEKFVLLLSYSGFTAETSAKMYFQKNLVNQFRQRTNY